MSARYLRVAWIVESIHASSHLSHFILHLLLLELYLLFNCGHLLLQGGLLCDCLIQFVADHGELLHDCCQHVAGVATVRCDVITLCACAAAAKLQQAKQNNAKSTQHV